MHYVAIKPRRKLIARLLDGGWRPAAPKEWRGAGRKNGIPSLLDEFRTVSRFIIRLRDDADFERKHPRGHGGEFASNPGAQGASTKDISRISGRPRVNIPPKEYRRFISAVDSNPVRFRGREGRICRIDVDDFSYWFEYGGPGGDHFIVGVKEND